MRRALAIPALVCPALAAGCSFGPDHRRPEVPTPESFTDSEPAESIANLPWWEVFGDPALHELIGTALTEHQDLLAATWRIEEATARVAVPAFRRQIRIVENALRLLLGRAPGEIARGEWLSEKNLPDDPPVGLPSELLERRPDIVRAEAILRASTARIGVAEALRFPSLSLTGFLGLQSEQLSDLASGETWSVGADLLGPIYEFDRNVERVAAERARAEQAVLAYEATVLSAFRDVEDALISFRTLREEYEARLAQVAASRQAQVLSRARYDGGVTSYLEVLDIERSLFQSELETSRTLGEHLSALVDLYASLGGGWDPEEEVILPAARIDPPEE